METLNVFPMVFKYPIVHLQAVDQTVDVGILQKSCSELHFVLSLNDVSIQSEG